MIKLFVSDLDGTLYYDGEKHNSTLTKETIEAINQLNREGIEFAIATGREHGTSNHVSEQIGFGIDAIGTNGCCVVYHGTVLANHTISSESALAICDLFERSGIEGTILYIDGKGHHVMSKPEGHYYDLFHEMRSRGEVQFIFDGTVQKWLSEPREEFNKAVILLEHPEDRDTISDQLRPLLQTYNLDMMYSSATYVELVPHGVDKAMGIEVIMKQLGISDDEVAVIGDSFNDEAMIKRFKHSYVMSHAEEELLAMGNTIVHTVKEAIDDVLRINHAAI